MWLCVMAPPIHLGAWSLLWLPFELLFTEVEADAHTDCVVGKNAVPILQLWRCP